MRRTRSSRSSSGYKPTPTLPKWLCAWRTPAFAIGTSAPSIAGSSPSSRRCPDSAAETAASTPMVTVGLRSWERCRITVRILRAPAGRVLVRNTGRGSACGGTRPAAVSRSSCRWARAALKLRQGSAAPRNGGAAATAGTTEARPNISAASAEDRMPSPSACTACNTATVPAPAAPGTPSTGVKTCSRQAIARASS